MQGHQKIAGRSDPAQDVILHRDDGRFAGPGGQRDMGKAQIPGVVDGQRATEPHAAEEADIAAAQQRQVHHGQKRLVPADSDPVFRNAPKSGQNAFIQFLLQDGKIADGRGHRPAAARERIGDRFELQAIDPDHAKPLVGQEVCQGVTRRSQAHHQDIHAVVGQGMRTLVVEGIEPRQQTVNLKAQR